MTRNDISAYTVLGANKRASKKELKMAIFYNQAQISLGNNITGSNVVEGELLSQVTLTKTTVTTDFGPGDNIVYLVTMVNTDTTDKTNITLTDDLGLFTTDSGQNLVPLTYVEDSVIYYQNGILQTSPTVSAGPPLVISGINLPAGGNVTLLYEARANEYAPRESASTISNSVSATGTGLCDNLTGDATVPVRVEPTLTIAKALSPDEITCGGQISYTFIIQNTGNAEVTTTDNLIVSDSFTPPLTSVTVQLNGTVLSETTDYTYDEATGAFTTVGGTVTVPSASFTRDATTGIITTTPGVSILTVTGTI